MDTKVADPMHGALVGGRYRILGRLARGGIATVYQARDERLDRIVAVKLIHASHAHDPRLLGRLSDEAKTIARLAHPNVVAVYDQGTHDDAPYLVMEFVRGRTLREVLHERHRLDPPEALAILEQILAALAVAHRIGLVHRDVKPENVLVAPPPSGSGDLVDAVVKVGDFGLAHAVEVGHRAGKGSGGVIPTAEYVAPEIVAGDPPDARADVYSAGVILFEMLTGRVPFAGETPADVAWQHVEQDVPVPSLIVPAVPPPVDNLVLHATRRDPVGRPRDAAALLSAVQATRDNVAAHDAPHVVPGPGGRRSAAAPTVVVTTVPRQPDPRPYWARLPASRGPLLTRGPIAAAGRRMIEMVPRQQMRGAWASFLAYAERLRSTERGRRQLLAGLVVVGLLLLVGFWWVAFGRYVPAPALVALTKDSAVAEATRQGFHVAYGTGRYTEEVPVDVVLDQRPRPGGRIVRGGTVTLILSLGPERYLVPEVAGQAADFATAQLREHFVVEVTDGYSDTLPLNYVVGTDPPAGTPLEPGAVVKLILAKHPYPVHIPTVVGLQLSEAESQLRGLGFDVEVQRRDDESKPRDTVLEQNPNGGQGLTSAKGVKVILVVANGPPGVSMPNVKGVGCNQARATLEQLGLQVSQHGLGFWVTRQQPDPGTQLQPGQQVEIRCGLFG